MHGAIPLAAYLCVHVLQCPVAHTVISCAIATCGAAIQFTIGMLHGFHLRHCMDQERRTHTPMAAKVNEKICGVL